MRWGHANILCWAYGQYHRADILNVVPVSQCLDDWYKDLHKAEEVRLHVYFNTWQHSVEIGMESCQISLLRFFPSFKCNESLKNHTASYILDMNPKFAASVAALGFVKCHCNNCTLYEALLSSFCYSKRGPSCRQRVGSTEKYGNERVHGKYFQGLLQLASIPSQMFAQHPLTVLGVVAVRAVT